MAEQIKIQLRVSDAYQQILKEKLKKAELEIDEDGPFLLSEKEQFPSHVAVKDSEGNKSWLKVEDIVFIESFGHDVVIHTLEGKDYQVMERLYQLEGSLDELKFIRVSNCAIIAKSQVKKVRAALSRKLVLTMSNGALVDVTRSYYPAFKKFLGI